MSARARKVGGRRRARDGKQSIVDSASVRKWAQSNGIELSQRGRIPADVVERYKAAGN
jgi:hypothetical protein